MKSKKTARQVSLLLALSALGVCTGFEQGQSQEPTVLQEYVVTATKTNMLHSESPTTMDVITGKQIEAMHANTLGDALRSALGINVFNDFQGRNNVSIRGSESRHVLILVDGRRMSGELSYNSANAYELNRIPMDNIARVEVIRGAAGAMYGSDAIGGVINVITKNAKGHHGSVSYEHAWYHNGENAGYPVTVAVRGSDGKWSYKGSVRRSEQHALREDGNDLNNDGHDVPASLEVGYALTDHSKLRAGYDYYKEHFTNQSWDIMKMGPMKMHRDTTIINDNKRTGWHVTYEGNNNKNTWLVRTYQSTYDKTYESLKVYKPIPGAMGAGSGNMGMGQPSMGQPSMGKPSMGKPSMGQPSMGQPNMNKPAIGQPKMGSGMENPKMGSGMGASMSSGMSAGMGSGMDKPAMGKENAPKIDTVKRTLTVFEGYNTIHVNDKHDVTVGFEYRKDNSKGTRLKKATTKLAGASALHAYDEASIQYLGAYVQDEWRPSSVWLVVPSLRFDHSDKFGNSVTAGVGTTRKLDDSLSLKAVIAQGYKAPTVNELYHFWEMYSGSSAKRLGEFFVGNPDLKPEKSTNMEFNVEKMWGNHTTGHIGFFHNEVRDLIETVDTQARTGDYPSEFPAVPWDRIMTYKNIPKAVMQGVEIYGTHSINKVWKLRAGYTYLDAKNVTDHTRLTNRSRHQITVGVQYYPTNPYAWNATFDLVTRKGYYAYDKEQSTMEHSVYGNKNFTVANIMFNKKVNKDLQVFLGVDNIGNYQSAGAYSNNELGRLYRLGMKWSW